MSVISTAKAIIKKGYICDHCLGRQFSQLLTGITNVERGRIVRAVLAMEYEIKPYKTELSNFWQTKFHTAITVPKPKSCWVCGGLFDRLTSLAERVARKLAGYQYDSFVVGSRLSDDMLAAEDRLWRIAGFKWAESAKSELNRELGKVLEKRLKKKSDRRSPDIEILVDLARSTITVRPRPLYIKGFYKKLIRGIPQTKKAGYKLSVQQIIEKPLLSAAQAKTSSFHGAGREDIDVRCLDWRPFVIELKNPKRFRLPLKRIRALINRSKAVRVNNLSRTTKLEVSTIKAARYDKSYTILVRTEKAINDLSPLKGLIGTIEQWTPTRVAHRRARRLRKRVVKEVSYRALSKTRFKLTVRAEAGLYVKELVTGDQGRTKPSVTSFLGFDANPISVDVIKIWLEEQKG